MIENINKELLTKLVEIASVCGRDDHPKLDFNLNGDRPDFTGDQLEYERWKKIVDDAIEKGHVIKNVKHITEIDGDIVNEYQIWYHASDELFDLVKNMVRL